MNDVMPADAQTPRSSLWLPCRALAHREIVRFFRQRGRVAGALGTPLVFWLLIGSGVRDSFVLPGPSGSISYLEYSFPGAVTAVLMFTAVFASISIIDDRREGFLQGVLVAPGSRAAIVLGKALGATALAVGQAGLLLAVAPLAGIRPPVSGVFLALAAMGLIALGMTTLGIWVAWRMESSQGFHAVMNLLLMPMLFLSGAFFPLSGAAGWLRWLMVINPLTYGVSLLRSALNLQAATPGPTSDPRLALLVCLGFAGLTLAGSVRAIARQAERTIT